MKKKNYVKPIACCIVSYSNTHLLAGGSTEESWDPEPFEPGAKKNSLSSEETDDEDQFQSNSVAGSTKNLWND